MSHDSRAPADNSKAEAAILDTAWLVAEANGLGFDLCGVAAASDLAGDSAGAEKLAEWLGRGFAGEMRYLHDARRGDLASVLAEARSVIVCAVSYDQSGPYSVHAAAADPATDAPRGWISRYAWGDDYHAVVGEMLDRVLAALRERYGDGFVARPYVDTGPISERAAAKMAGLGWLGKNTCLINRDAGSFLFLGVIITSLAAPGLQRADFALAPDLCGNCTLCLEACPTGALVEPYVMDARRCISYLTIELRGSIPEELRAGMGWQVFGCDICQDVCPWNRADAAAVRAGGAEAQPPAAAFAPRAGLVAPQLDWLLELSEANFRERFRGSPVKRAKWRGLVRNACVAAGNALRAERASQRARGDALRDVLARLAASDDAVIAEHARWALQQGAQEPRA